MNGKYLLCYIYIYIYIYVNLILVKIIYVRFVYLCRTDLVSAEDDVNLRMSTGLSAAIDEGRRRRR